MKIPLRSGTVRGLCGSREPLISRGIRKNMARKKEKTHPTANSQNRGTLGDGRWRPFSMDAYVSFFLFGFWKRCWYQMYGKEKGDRDNKLFACQRKEQKQWEPPCPRKESGKRRKWNPPGQPSSARLAVTTRGQGGGRMERIKCERKNSRRFSGLRSIIRLI